MRTKMKAAMLTAALALLTSTFAYADTNPANDSGVFSVRLVPNVDLGVIVDTTGSNWDGSANLDKTMDLGTNEYLDTPIGIEMAGNFVKQELTLTGVALNTWQLDTDELDAVNELRLYAVFGRSAYLGSPGEAEFDGTNNLIITTPRRAGQPHSDEVGFTDNNRSYELLDGTDAEYDQVDDLTPGDERKLWLRARTPSISTTDGQAQFTVTVTAVTGVGL